MTVARDSLSALSTDFKRSLYHRLSSMFRNDPNMNLQKDQTKLSSMFCHDPNMNLQKDQTKLSSMFHHDPNMNLQKDQTKQVIHGTFLS